MGDTATVLPHNVHVRLNVGGTHLHTSLNTVLEGARLGYGCFQTLCVNILQAPHDSSQEAVWSRVKLVPTTMEQNRVHFIDADPEHLSLWLGYFRTRKVPYVEAGSLRQRLIAESEEAGLKDLADELRRLVDWRRADLQRLLVHRGAVLHGARLQGQDLSRLGFLECSLVYADLSGCNLSYCSFRGADLSGADLRNTIWHHAKLNGADLLGADLRDADLSGADLSGANLSNTKLQDARLPAWSSGLLEGVKFAGAEGWVPADKDLSNAQLQGADLLSCDLSGANLSSADLRGANLSNANMKSVNFTNAKVLNALLPAWSSGLLEGVNLAGAEGWVPADKDLSKAKLKDADMSDSDLSGIDLSNSDLQSANLSQANLQNANLTYAHLQGARLPAWSSGLLEGVKLAGAKGWVPADKDLSNAKLKGADLSKAKLQGAVLKGADLSKCDLSGADLTGADLREAKLEGTNLRDATLRAALLHAAQGARHATKVPVPGTSGNLFNAIGNLKVGEPVVFALTAPRALTLLRVTLCNQYGDGNSDKYCPKAMEVQTGPSATGPWTSVVKFTSRQTKQEQTFAAAPDAPLLFGFVQVLVHDTYGEYALVKSMALEGEGWG